MDKVLVIIPAYNEALNIERVVTRLQEEYPIYDYVIVNDGSADETAAIFFSTKNVSSMETTISTHRSITVIARSPFSYLLPRFRKFCTSRMENIIFPMYRAALTGFK